jgi:hypothetical protein
MVNPGDAVYCSACGQIIENTVFKTSAETVVTVRNDDLSVSDLESLTDKELNNLCSDYVKNQLTPRPAILEEIRRRALKVRKNRNADTGAASASPSAFPYPTSHSGTDSLTGDIQPAILSPVRSSPALSPAVAKDGKKLHVKRGAQLLPCCIKCGRATTYFRKTKFYWHPPWLLALLLLGLWPYVIVALLARKRMDLKVPLCAAHRKRFRLFQILSPTIVVGALCLFVSGFYAPEQFVEVVTGAILLICGLIFWQITSTLLKPSSIDADGGIFRGCNDEFLARLPERSQASASVALQPVVNGVSSGAVARAGSSAISVPGTMGQRLIAYLADLVLVYLVVLAAVFIGGLYGWNLAESSLSINLVYFAALFTYMVVAQTTYHTTVGKYIKGLEVSSEKAGRKYPTVILIVLRETLGRLLSSLFFGAGYWSADKSTKNQAWSDQISATLVTIRPTNRVLVRAFSAFVLIAFLLDASVTGFGLYKQDWEKRYAAFNAEVEATTKEVVATRDQVDQRLNSEKPVNDWSEFLLWQERMRSMRKDLDRYETQIDRMQALLQKGINEGLVSSQAERHQYIKLREVYDTRRRQVEKRRQEADLIVHCDGQPTSIANLRNDLQLLDSDIDSLDVEASKGLQEIGIK